MRQLRRSMIARAAIGCWREPMQSWKRVAPIAVPFLIIIAVTDVGYFFKDVAHARHLVFFYLLPTAFVAMLYGSVLSMIVAIDAQPSSQRFFFASRASPSMCRIRVRWANCSSSHVPR